MLKNAYLLAKIGADTAENERNFAEILPTTDNYPTGPLPYAPCPAIVGSALARWRAWWYLHRGAVRCRSRRSFAGLNGCYILDGPNCH